jgi:hypothetical protein
LSGISMPGSGFPRYNQIRAICLIRRQIRQNIRATYRHQTA